MQRAQIVEVGPCDQLLFCKCQHSAIQQRTQQAQRVRDVALSPEFDSVDNVSPTPRRLRPIAPIHTALRPQLIKGKSHIVFAGLAVPAFQGRCKQVPPTIKVDPNWLHHRQSHFALNLVELGNGKGEMRSSLIASELLQNDERRSTAWRRGPNHRVQTRV